MGTRTMSDETKAKIAASRAKKKAEKEAAIARGETPPDTGKKASLDDQVAAAQALADSGDATATQLMPVVDVLREQMNQAKADGKAAARKLRKTLAILK